MFYPICSGDYGVLSEYLINEHKAVKVAYDKRKTREGFSDFIANKQISFPLQ